MFSCCIWIEGIVPHLEYTDIILIIVNPWSSICFTILENSLFETTKSFFVNGKWKCFDDFGEFLLNALYTAI